MTEPLMNAHVMKVEPEILQEFKAALERAFVEVMSRWTDDIIRRLREELATHGEEIR